MQEPTLKFDRGDQAGFTTVGLSEFHDIKPQAVVRELIQNSLDAAVYAGRDCAHVQFVLKTIPTADIPGIEQYRQAFHDAVSSQKEISSNGELPMQAQRIVNTIAAALKNDEVEFLFVRDNGTGLDVPRMRSLLSDGVSYQPDTQATGAYGNGHMVAVPASELRYLLYGGVVKSGERICSGHAVLASREGPGGSTLSKDGYFVSDLEGGFKARYSFPGNNLIPGLIGKELCYIQNKWQHGSVVIIPGFNRFLPRKPEDFSLQKTILEAAASNFFHAIHGERLVVETEHDGQEDRLDHQSIGRILAQNSEAQRGASGFLSGALAYEAFQALSEEATIVETPEGKATVHLKCDDEEKTRVHLCRNGMWITRKVPKNDDGKFTDRKPFTGVICIDEKSGLKKLIRQAEGPLHTELSRKRLEKADWKRLEECLDAIRKHLHQEAPEMQEEAFWAGDILSIPGSGSASPVAIPSRPAIGGHGPTPERRGKGPREKKKKSSDKQGPGWRSSPLSFEAVATPKSEDTYRISLVPQANCPNSELRLVVDESTDATCTNRPQDSFAILNKVEFISTPTPPYAFIKDPEGRPVGVQIKDLRKDTAHVMEVQYQLPNNLPSSSNVLLRVEIMKHREKKKGKKRTKTRTSGG